MENLRNEDSIKNLVDVYNEAQSKSLQEWLLWIAKNNFTLDKQLEALGERTQAMYEYFAPKLGMTVEEVRENVNIGNIDIAALVSKYNVTYEDMNKWTK